MLIDRSLPPRPQLVVWFPGCCAPPPPYRVLLREAASSGYRVLGLNYPNCPEVHETCNAHQPIDPDCQEEMRTERLFGVDASPLITVTPANSIRNRLVKLLEYLPKGSLVGAMPKMLSPDVLAWAEETLREPQDRVVRLEPVA